MIHTVVVDMDGTFLRDDMTYDRPRFVELRRAMLARDIAFVVASGNQYYQLRTFFQPSDEAAYVSDNGSFVVPVGANEFSPLAASIWDRADVLDSLDLIDGLDGVDVFMCGVRSAYARRDMRPDVLAALRPWHVQLALVDELRDVDDDVLKLALITPPGAREMAADLDERLPAAVRPVYSGHSSVDVIRRGVSKATGLAALMDHLGRSLDGVVAFGDSGNDVEMLAECGLSYAMAQAGDEIKAVARHVAPSNNDDGVLEVLSTLL